MIVEYRAKHIGEDGITVIGQTLDSLGIPHLGDSVLFQGEDVALIVHNTTLVPGIKWIVTVSMLKTEAEALLKRLSGCE